MPKTHTHTHKNKKTCKAVLTIKSLKALRNRMHTNAKQITHVQRFYVRAWRHTRNCNNDTNTHCIDWHWLTHRGQLLRTTHFCEQTHAHAQHLPFGNLIHFTTSVLHRNSRNYLIHFVIHTNASYVPMIFAWRKCFSASVLQAFGCFFFLLPIFVRDKKNLSATTHKNSLISCLCQRCTAEENLTILSKVKRH